MEFAVGSLVALVAVAWVLYPIFAAGTATTRCAACGMEMPGRSRFCPHCGAARQ